MRIFHCDHCSQLVFFENSECVNCRRPLAFLPDAGYIGSLDKRDDGTWHSPVPALAGKAYRLCRNYTEHAVCNWAVEAEDNNELCRSCRLTRVIPDLSVEANKLAWYKLEMAKRRLLYNLIALGLPLETKTEAPERGLAFEFLSGTAEAPVFTGHSNGLITINAAEADDAERERRRVQLHEPYRTLLGHFRHEIGHYYWERLIAGAQRSDGGVIPAEAGNQILGEFRRVFGDEQADYRTALEQHYQNGAPAGWQETFISTYAASHPWEDWAETWAHYLHMIDTLETAAACGLSLKPKRADEPALRARTQVIELGLFERMIADWYPLTYVLNNLNRGVGMPDGYPFILSAAVIEKLRFIHDTVATGGK